MEDLYGLILKSGGFVLNRPLAALTGLLALTTGSLCADAKGQPTNSMNMKGNDMSSSREITPSAIPSTKDHTAFYFAGDFIYWQAQEDGLEIGPSGSTSETAGVINSQGTSRFINSGYAPGFKFSMGIDFMRDGWDTVVEYTWYDNTNQTGTNHTTTTGTVVDAGFTLPSTGTGTASWSIYFNNINWELGRKFYVSKYLTLRPHVGLKGSWLHQTLTGSYSYTFAQEAGSVLGFEHSKFWGVGIRGGLNTEWFLAKGFSIYADIALAEVSGRASGRARAEVVDPVSANLSATPATLGGVIGPSSNSYIRAGLNRMRPVLELALGLRYDVGFGEDDYYRFMIQTGWEQQIWWNQNNFVTTSGTSKYGDLSFQGLDVKVGFTF